MNKQVGVEQPPVNQVVTSDEPQTAAQKMYQRLWCAQAEINSLRRASTLRALGAGCIGTVIGVLVTFLLRTVVLRTFMLQ